MRFHVVYSTGVIPFETSILQGHDEHCSKICFVGTVIIISYVHNCYYVLHDYTTIQRMTIPRLTKWRPDFDILMIQWLFFFKKAKFFFPTPHEFHLKTFPTPYGCQKGLTLPLTGFFYPWRVLIFSLKKLFLTPNWLQIGKNGLNWPSSFFYM